MEKYFVDNSGIEKYDWCGVSLKMINLLVADLIRFGQHLSCQSYKINFVLKRIISP